MAVVRLKLNFHYFDVCIKLEDYLKEVRKLDEIIYFFEFLKLF